MLKKLVFIGALLGASLSLAGSKIGGGSITSQTLGYETLVPPMFDNVGGIEGDNFSLIGPVSFRVNGLVQQQLTTFDLAENFPDLKGKTREEIRDEYLLKGWTEETRQDSCVLMLSKSTTSSYNTLLAWGSIKGILIVGTETPQVPDAIKYMVEHLVLQPGACAW